MEEMIAKSLGTTLDRFINEKQAEFPFATGELSQLLRDLALAAKITNRDINRAGLTDITGSFNKQNVQGEEQQRLDVIANVRFMRALKKGGEVCAIVSEEEEDINYTGNHNAKYVVAIDPLDGSSNIDVNVAIGTIFSIYRRKSKIGEIANLDDVLQKGIDQIAAGYILYGSSTMLVYTTGHGVNGFTYEPSLGEFFLSHPNMKTPETGRVYSINEGNYDDFEPSLKSYINLCRERSYTSRYIGSLVADFHRNLLKGGIYVYPATKASPTGKLRLIYECNALAFIVEQAGGVATDGQNRILDIEPTELHQRVAYYVGSTKMVKEAMSFH